MKKKILLAALVVCLLCGCEKTIPKLENGQEAVVSFKDGSMISVDELYNEMKSNHATQILIDMIDTKILEGKYADKLEDADNNAKSGVESVKLYYTDEDGNYDENALVNALNQYYGYTSVDEYQKMLRLNYLRNLAVEDYAKSQVKESEIKKYYKDSIVGDREVSHILIVPKVKTTMTDDEKSEAENEALNTAKEVIARLKKGDSFDDLVKEFSEDESTKDSNGSLGYINKGSYGDDAFDNEVYSLKVGSYSSAPVKTSRGYEIIYVTAEKEKATLDEVRDKIVETLAEENLDKDATIQVNGLRELRKEYGIDIVDDEISTQYNRYMNNLYNSAVQQNASK